MKATPLIVFVVLVGAVSRTSGCNSNIEDCEDITFNSLCAGKPGQWPMSFGSLCALNVHNCVYKESLKVVSSGKCTGIAIRILSDDDFITENNEV